MGKVKFVSELDGVQVTLSNMSHMKTAVKRRVIRSAITKAVRVLAKEAKKLAPKDSGLLKKSIGQVVRTYKNGRIVGVVGPRRGFKQMVSRTKRFPAKVGESVFQAGDFVVAELADPANYAHLVEFGTEPHSIGKGDDRVKKSGGAGSQIGSTHPGNRAQPFMRPAFESKKREAEATYVEGFRDAFARESMKLRKKGITRVR